MSVPVQSRNLVERKEKIEHLRFETDAERLGPTPLGLAVLLIPATELVLTGAGLPARDVDGVPLAERLNLSCLLRLPESVASVSLPDPAPRSRLTGAFNPSLVGPAAPSPSPDKCFFFAFLREDSLPLASERLGDPVRLSDELAFLTASIVLGRPEGVLVPLLDAPEPTCALSLPLDCSSSAFFFSSSSFLRRSTSESSELCIQG